MNPRDIFAIENPEWAPMVDAYIAKVKEQGRKEGIKQAEEVLASLHGKTLGRHNYYAHAAIEVRKLRKKA